MRKVDPVIIKETKYIALVVLILSALMEAVFLIIGKWDLSILFGNLLGALTGILNFLLMGIGLQSALSKDKDDAKMTAKFSRVMRNLIIIIVLVVAALVEPISLLAAALGIFFPSIGVFAKAFIIKKQERDGGSRT